MSGAHWDDYRQALQGAQHRVDGARAALQQRVTEARFAGVPWSVIGGALGMTRQAAQQRFR